MTSNNGNVEETEEEVQNDSGYPVEEMADQIEAQDKGTKVGQKGTGGQGKERADKDAQSQKSGGYSTDVDQLARSKRLLALESSWMQRASSNEITHDGLQRLIESSIKDHVKQYESIRNSMSKAIVLLSDLHGGLIKLGWICQPNNPYRVENLSLFVDNMFTYGANYIGIEDTYSVY